MSGKNGYALCVCTWIPKT
nr:unnamed protein product [Callosobruchus chinensis]